MKCFWKLTESTPFTVFEIPEWPNRSPLWSKQALSLLLEAAGKQQQKVTLQDILDNSDSFPIPFPIDTVRCRILRECVPQEVLERNINSAYPILHEKVLALYADFLIHKRTFGNKKEKDFYANMSILELIQRLLLKRAVIFVSSEDRYRLLDGTEGFEQWEKIGTDDETSELNLSSCLSYDEIKLSALLSVSSYSHFINDGSRHNKGITKREQTESNGIIIGIIGARLRKRNAMEFQEVVITKDQNREPNGYGAHSASSMHTLFADFYGTTCFTYKQALKHKRKEPSRFTEIYKATFFDNNVYCKRINLSIDTLLLDANQRAKDENITAVVHIVGIGLGVWKLSPHQDSLFLDTCAKRIQ